MYYSNSLTTFIMFRVNFYLLLLVIIFGILSGGVKAQDVVYTQFIQSPLTLNPAITGVFNGDLRVTANYRNQWSSILRGDAINAYAFSADKRFALGRNHVGIGVVGHFDRAGSLRIGTTQGKASFSFIKSIGQSETSSHFLSFGQDVGIVKRSMDFISSTFPDTLMFITDFLHFDLTTGLSWVSQLEGHNRFNLGVAVHHINGPNVSFFSNRIEHLNRRLTVHGGGEIALSQVISVTPLFLYNKQGEHNALQIGTGIRKYFSEDPNANHVDIGVHGQFSDSFFGFEDTAIIAVARLSLSHFMIGLSYDRPTNDLILAGGFNGAVEMTVGYTFGNFVDGRRFDVF